jgi:hypothetical protein
MVTFKNIGKMGRLGNQLFQYAAIRSLALNNGYDFKLPNISNKSFHGQVSLLNKFNIKNDYLNFFENFFIRNNYIEPNWRHVDYNFYNIKDNTSISGYFQSMYYFEKYMDIIKNELTPKDEILEKNKQYINNLKKIYNCEITSIHVRRGDNMENGQKELIEAFKPNGLYDLYFNRAKNIYKEKNTKFLVFTGGKRGKSSNSDDLLWCKSFFQGEEFLFSEAQNEIDDFCLIMNCDNNILSHASSFGWWAAFLNPNPNKTVVAPEYYHPDEPTLKREMFYPTNYILC